MKVLCDRHQLNEGFGIVAGIAPLKSTKPIVQNVLLTAADDTLTLFATDLEMAARVQLRSVKVDEPGSVCLPAREAHALLRELSDPTIALQSQDGRCRIECGGGAFQLVSEDPEQFPQAKDIGEAASTRVAAGQLLSMIRRTGFAAAKEETRYAINGVLLHVKGDLMRLVATDGRRLALTYAPIEGDTPAKSQIVPLRALQALARALSDGSEEPVEIAFGTNQILFRLGEVELLSRLLDARFPDYEAVIPKAADTTIELSRDLLQGNLRKVSVVCGGDARMVRFDFGSSSLALTAEGQSGRGHVVLDADVKGAGGSITFNPDFVIEALKVADFETIRVDMTDDATPAKFSLGEAFTYVLMPISGS